MRRVAAAWPLWRPRSCWRPSTRCSRTQVSVLVFSAGALWDLEGTLLTTCLSALRTVCTCTCAHVCMCVHVRMHSMQQPGAKECMPVWLYSPANPALCCLLPLLLFCFLMAGCCICHKWLHHILPSNAPPTIAMCVCSRRFSFLCLGILSQRVSPSHFASALWASPITPFVSGPQSLRQRLSDGHSPFVFSLMPRAELHLKS